MRSFIQKASRGKNLKKKINQAGFTLLESIVSIAIFSILSIGVYQTLIQASKLVNISRLFVDSAEIANQQFEIAHNLPYASVGVVNGLVAGSLSPSQTITRNNTDFLVETTVRSIDDPFDGTIGGSPNDTSPADYKLMEVNITVPGNNKFSKQTFDEYIAPKNLENTTTNGALFIKVFDANGQPVPETNIHIENNSANPAIVVDDITNSQGILQLVDVPPGANVYHIEVSKDGYSSDQTYPLGGNDNPNPSVPDATVAAQQATQISFAIDKVGTLNFGSVTETCAPVANVAFQISGSKQISNNPIKIKYQKKLETGSSGEITINDLEWDTYNLSLTDNNYELGGTISPIPFDLAAGSTQDVKVVAAPKNPNSLLVNIKQGGTNLPLSGVQISLTKDSFNQILYTGRGFLRQSDWSGGSGQEIFTDSTSYADSDGNIETGDPAGELKLKKAFDSYALSGELTSSSFDTGSASNFYQLNFLPLDQPAAAGTSSVRLQVATNNDDSTWNFLGPDGTDSTYYTATNANIDSIHNGNRYLRYRLFLSTASSTVTPNIGEVNFTFSSLCVPPGQILFSGLDSGQYSINIDKGGFQSIENTVAISASWQEYDVTLMPQ
jgi:prepilin-type N-terminal cleavage/methylation domain-containing protein